VNDGTAVFEATEAPVLVDAGRGRAAVSTDFDGDGNVDLYLANLGQPNRLFLIQGDGTFVDGNAASGLGDDADSSMDAAAADFNGDGLLDLMVTNNGAQMNKLYLGVGIGRFQLANETAGTLSGNSVALTTADSNSDGTTDLFVVNENLPDQLYFNNLVYRPNCWH